MKRFLLIFFVLAAVAVSGAALAVYVTPPPPAPPVMPPPPATEAWSAVVMDAESGDVLAARNPERRVNPASTTKILTCIISLEEGHDRLQENAVITPRAMAAEGTTLGVRTDLPISLWEMLQGMMLISGNDAAVAAAETVGGSEERFVEMMNEKSAAIGAVHSHFANPNGLTDPGHYTTAEDMAKIAAYAMKNPQFRHIVSEKFHSMTYRDGMVRTVKNSNDFLFSGYAGANGIKTGTTDAAGDCLVASAERNGRLMIAVFYHDDRRWEDPPVWLDYGFSVMEKKLAYEQARAAEPAFYRMVNILTGRE